MTVTWLWLINLSWTDEEVITTESLIFLWFCMGQIWIPDRLVRAEGGCRGGTTTSFMHIREAWYHQCASGVHGCSPLWIHFTAYMVTKMAFFPHVRHLLSWLVYAHLRAHTFLAYSTGNWGWGTAEITIKTQLYWVALSVQRSVHETDWAGTTQKKLWCWFKWYYYFNYSNERRAA